MLETKQQLPTKLVLYRREALYQIYQRLNNVRYIVLRINIEVIRFAV